MYLESWLSGIGASLRGSSAFSQTPLSHPGVLLIPGPHHGLCNPEAPVSQADPIMPGRPICPESPLSPGRPLPGDPSYPASPLSPFGPGQPFGPGAPSSPLQPRALWKHSPESHE
ncbi:hypothetical protein B566_EDAN001392 [Ephemera danica]|nr:hypothetical protein B566_EDAN001392 [Ephemera danica]